jgi:hypothetical protein
MSNESEGGEVDKPTPLWKLTLAKRETKRATESMGPRMERKQNNDQ